MIALAALAAVVLVLAAYATHLRRDRDGWRAEAEHRTRSRNTAFEQLGSKVIENDDLRDEVVMWTLTAQASIGVEFAQAIVDVATKQVADAMAGAVSA